jgi:hypothetical protein
MRTAGTRVKTIAPSFVSVTSADKSASVPHPAPASIPRRRARMRRMATGSW